MPKRSFSFFTPRWRDRAMCWVTLSRQLWGAWGGAGVVRVGQRHRANSLPHRFFKSSGGVFKALEPHLRVN